MNSMTYVACFSFSNFLATPVGGPKALPEVLCALRRLFATMGDVSFAAFAPAPAETDGEASNPGPGLQRPRKRGPRSPAGQERRLIKHKIEYCCKKRIESPLSYFFDPSHSISMRFFLFLVRVLKNNAFIVRGLIRPF